MDMRKLFMTFKSLLLCLICVAALAGCSRSVPVAEIHTSLAATYQPDQVRLAIMQAGQKRQWKMEPTAPGVINARRNSKGHGAQIQINYDSTGYSIKYLSSSNLRADGTGRIHRAYNRWVYKLNKEIRRQLAQNALSAP